MKNVIVFALGQARYAVELRWVREVFTVGHVTPVPHAPDAVAGVVNYRGAVMPLIDLDAVLGRRSGAQPARAGESALLIEVEELTAALRLTSVVEVASLKPAPGGAPDLLVDSTGRQVPLIQPPELLARARQATITAAGALAIALAGPPSGDTP
jgi:chemotaxis signal transduction protein